MIRRLSRVLTPSQVSVVETVRKVCAAPVYLVGGPVRDLLLGRPVLDLDFVIVGPADEWVEKIASALSGTVKKHERFFTSKIRLPDGAEADVAETRTERYPEAGRLPVVERGATIEQDLTRRDFTIQAIALKLNGDDAGVIVDPFDGRGDLRRRTVRILHSESFRDDPVRAFRAVRYATRYGFRIEPQTRRAIRELLRKPEWLAAASDRIFDEWRRSFDEERWIEIQRGLVREKLTAWIGIRSLNDRGRLRLTDACVHAFSECQPPPERWAARWLAVLSFCSRNVRLCIAARMPFQKSLRKIFSAPTSPASIAHALDRRQKPSRVVQLLADQPSEWLSVLSIHARAAGRRLIRQFFAEWRHVPPPLTGEDLKKMGVPPGPAYPRILKTLHAARLDGRLKSVEDIRRIVSRAQSMK